jgi:hypothetical protein
MSIIMLIHDGSTFITESGFILATNHPKCRQMLPNTAKCRQGPPEIQFTGLNID